MSQSRFSIVLVGVSALLRRPLVSRLRPAAFTARGSGGFRRSALPSVSEIAARRVGLRAHGFRFSARTASGLPLGGLAFGLMASAFRHAPLRSCRSAGWPSGFRFGDGRSASWPSGSRLPLFGTHRFGVAARWVGSAAFRFGVATQRVGLRAHGFRFSACTASGLPSASWFFCSAGWPSGSRLPLFGMRRSAPPCRRREGRRSTPTRHLFHFKTLIPTC